MRKNPVNILLVLSAVLVEMPVAAFAFGSDAAAENGDWITRMLFVAVCNTLNHSVLSANIMGGGDFSPMLNIVLYTAVAVAVTSTIFAVVILLRERFWRRKIRLILRNRIAAHDVHTSEPVAAPDNIADETESSESTADNNGFMTRLESTARRLMAESNLNVHTLCREIGMSRTVLYNRLRAECGLNVKSFIDRIRMDYVKHLIADTRLSFTEIAVMTGFSSSRYFSTAFRHWTGMSPSEYRAACGDGEAAGDDL